ncbi:hypothetical protein [Candidatus Poriferisodalis sp.]|uniref:hypothetical protein n=1 Tax=Candidatus Poriferisodalis sp. TaxID=3101277 RepID=UPI003B0284D6
MTHIARLRTAWVAAAVAAALVLAGCTGGLSRAEVEEIVEESGGGGLSQAEIEQIAEAAGSGLSRADVTEIVQAAGSGLSRAEIEQIIHEAIASVAEPSVAPEAEAEIEAEAEAPPRSEPDNYTKHFVDLAISRYEAEGLAATLDYYNDPANVDGQWYGFIIGENDEIIGHYDPSRRGYDLKGWVGTDANGYNFGADMLSATPEGRWVTYVFLNPERLEAGFDPSGFELKRSWVVRHDGLLFGSGWYTDIDEFIQSQIATAVEIFRTEGLAELYASLNDPASNFAGLEATLAYYDTTGVLGGEWIGFVADADGKIVSAMLNRAYLGENVADVLGTDIVGRASADGNWIVEPSSEDASEVALRIFVAQHDGLTFGGGWRATSGR